MLFALVCVGVAFWWQTSVPPTGRAKEKTQRKESDKVASPRRPVDQGTVTVERGSGNSTKEINQVAVAQVQRSKAEVGVPGVEPTSFPSLEQIRPPDGEPPRAKRERSAGAITAVPAKQRDSAPRAEGSPSHPMNAERELFRLALLHQQMGDHQVASELYQKVLALNPRNAVALNNMGVILKQMGQLTEAGELLKKAIELDPSYDKAHTNLGVVHQLKEESQAAIESHLHALAINEKSWESAVNLGLLFWSEGNLESAKRFFSKALGIRHEASVLHHLGVIFDQQGQRPEAIRHYRQALQKGDGLTPQHREKIQLRLRELLGGEGAKSPGAQR